MAEDIQMNSAVLNIRSRVLVAMGTFVALSMTCMSCSSSTPAGDGGTASAATSEFSMKVNGTPWVAKGRIIGAAGSAGIGVSGNLDAAGSEQLTINVGGTAPGTYVADKATKASTGAVVFFNRGNTFFSSDIKASSFTVVVTKASGLAVEGTFSGTFEEAEAATGPDAGLAEKLVITEGKFVTVESQ